MTRDWYGSQNYSELIYNENYVFHAFTNACIWIINTFAVHRQFCLGIQIVIKKLFGAHGLGQGEDPPVRRAGCTFSSTKLALPGQMWL